LTDILTVLAEHAAHPSNYFAIHCKGCLWSAVDHVLKLDAYSGQAMKFLENVAPQDATIAYAEVSTALGDFEMVKPFQSGGLNEF